jgi:acyl carrier protein
MEILEQIQAIIKEFRGEDITLNIDDNFNDLGFDSLDRVELVMELEEKFGITFPDDVQIETVKELVETIEALKK